MALRENQVITLVGSEKWQYYSGDLDNCIDVPIVRTMMIGPLVTNDGQCKGVIQLINKHGGVISQAEQYEFSQMLQPIAQVIANIDDVRGMVYIQKGVSEHLRKAGLEIVRKINSLDERDLPKLTNSMSLICSQVTQLINLHKGCMISDPRTGREVIFATKRAAKKK